MRRLNLFLALLIASLVSLTVLIVAGFYLFSSVSQPYGNWFGGMMDGNTGRMMGGTGQTAVQNSAVPLFQVGFVVLIGVVVASVIGLAYYVALPEIETGTAPVVYEPVPEVKVEQEQKAACTPLESIVKTLSDEERKVIEVLNAHNGKYLQKYIRNEAGLSRLQTHRIVARLAERGIVTLRKTGNTNQVLLADWLKK
jgi:uncharacterized membrane protein